MSDKPHIQTGHISWSPDYDSKKPPIKLSELASSPCSLKILKTDFDRAIAAMTDEQIIAAFREAGCEVTIQRKENQSGQEREASADPNCSK